MNSFLPHRAGTALDALLKHTGLDEILQGKDLLAHWENVVGEQIARHVRLVDVNKGTLLLQTDSSVWKNEILFRKKTIFQRSNEVLGKTVIHSLRFI